METDQKPPVPFETLSLALIQSIVMAQPRAIRVYNDRMEVIWDGAKDRFERYAIFRDAADNVVSEPLTQTECEAWPVWLAFQEMQGAEREYEVRTGPILSRGNFLVRAYPVKCDASDTLYVVEETERLHHLPTSEFFLQKMESDLTKMISQACEVMQQEQEPSNMRFRMQYESLDPCYDTYRCPLHSKDSKLPLATKPPFCPEDEGSFTGASGNAQRCEKCEVYMLTCPESLRRMGEQINLLFEMIQSKYEETQKVHQVMHQADKMAMIGELTMGIAHEVKNPLSIILGRLDCLSLEIESLSSDEISEDLEVIRSHAVRMRTVLERFLNLARPTSPDLRMLSASKLIRDVLSMMGKTLESAHILSRMQCAENLPQIHADPEQIQQVLINLILNARDAMCKGGELLIRTRRTEPAGLTIDVRDTGSGIPTENLENIFSPFFTTKAKKGGTGLGLEVCKKIMQQHHGKIKVQSTLGEGATFSLWFPVKGIAS